MAIHTDLPSMSREAIEEYLAIAHYCVTTRKPNGGVYGYPAVLLLLAVVDALSNYAGYPEHSFLALKNIFPALTEQQIKSLARWYRHLLSHQAIIMPGTQLTVDAPGDAIEFNSDGEPTHIRVEQFYEAIKGAWDKMDASGINPMFHPAQAPKTPIATTISVFPAASGRQAVTTTIPTSSTTLSPRK